MDRKKLMLLVGALIVAIGTAFAARSMFAGASSPQAVAAAKMPMGAKVLVANRALPAGTIITADAMGYQPWPKDLVQDVYFTEDKTDMSKLLGTVVRTPITAGGPVTQGSLVAPGDRGFVRAHRVFIAFGLARRHRGGVCGQVTWAQRLVPLHPSGCPLACTCHGAGPRFDGALGFA